MDVMVAAGHDDFVDGTSEPMLAYYARDRERDRLDTGAGRVEFARTIEVLEHALPPAPATIADIGCGPGRYVSWLVDAGYEVIARDPVAAHIDQVQGLPVVEVDAAVGDARSIDLADDSVDAVLLLGPLYHLPAAEDRSQALAEASRIVRPGGVVVAAGILRWAVRLDPILVKEAHTEDPGLLAEVDVLERDGFMRPLSPGGIHRLWAHAGRVPLRDRTSRFERRLTRVSRGNRLRTRRPR